MLNQKDVSLFEGLVQEALRNLPERSALPVVHQLLYLHKDGSWGVRSLMSGHSLGRPPLIDLMKHYAFAVSGIDPTVEQIEERGVVVLDRMTESLRQALNELRATGGHSALQTSG